MPFLQEVSLEVILCAYFINGMFLVGALALNAPIYTPFNTAQTVSGVSIPKELQTNFSNNLVTNMTTNIHNTTSSNPIINTLQSNPFAFLQYVFIFLTFITGTFPFLLLGNFLVGSPTVVLFGFIVGGFVLFCLARTVLFYTRGV